MTVTVLKVFWMLLWRLLLLVVVVSPLLLREVGTLVGLAVLLAVVGACTIVLGFRKNVHAFPVVRALTRREVVFEHVRRPTRFEPVVRSSPGYGTPPGSPVPPPVTPPPPVTTTSSVPLPPPVAADALPRATARGAMTGYEPRVLAGVPASISVNVRGAAGLGLFGAGFGDAQRHAGQRGEIGFYKALCVSGLVDAFTSYWSVALPASNLPVRPDPVFSTDIDCVVVSGTTLVLLDLKYYASGDVTWFSDDGAYLQCRDNPTGKTVQKPRRMSKNMKMADERFRRLFPGHTVRSRVVLIPTDQGLGSVAPGTVWPGGIPLVGLPELIDELRALAPTTLDLALDTTLRSLLKG